MSVRYFYQQNGQLRGPLVRQQIADLIMADVLPIDVPVWGQGMRRWSAAGDMPDLVELLPPPGQKPGKRRAMTGLRWPVDIDSPVEAYARLGERLVAGLIDLGLMALVFHILANLLGLAQQIPADIQLGSQGLRALPTELMAQLNFLMLAIAAPYFILFLSRLGHGQTLGYRLMRLRLVGEDTGVPPATQVVGLWLFAYYLLMPICFVSIFLDRRRRMLHNYLSGTAVVRVLN